MASLHFIGLLFVVATVSGQTATSSNFDCKQRPPFTPDIKNCCSKPTLKLDSYKQSCANTTFAGRFGGKAENSHAFMNPCSVECIYTQAGALSNGQFNMVKMNAFLKEIMPSNPEMANVFLAGFQTCGPDVRKKMQEFEANSKGQIVQFPGSQAQCSPFAVVTTFCAMRHTFINCPPKAWTSSDMCVTALNYVKNCEPMQFGGPRRQRRATKLLFPSFN